MLLEYVKNENLIDLGKYTESVFRMLSKMIGNLESYPTRQSPLTKSHTHEPKPNHQTPPTTRHNGTYFL